ncbi:hypothetical protein H8S95_14240 [Pontibacter sp. KCTC 32443]|uniref:hypothetical protein n=1 Tax=Pontibacter TaxID=323449 RepID=UPI00164D56DA|nr:MULTISPECIES: hypothetical protein [Pontibacter]MBC5775235.1 hypothetical protein [Pontibacter sp. KCTC 32443]
MKFISNLKMWLPVLLCTCLIACDPNTKQEASRDLSDFSNWVNQNAERAPMLTNEEWEELNTEYENRVSELEAESDKWDDQTRQQWEGIKAKWAEAEQQVKQKDQRVEAVDADLDMDTVKEE